MDPAGEQKPVSVDEAASQAHHFLAPVLGKGTLTSESANI